MGEDAQTAVLRLDGVVADPDAGVADLGAAELVVLGAGGAGVGAEGEPAVGPDRVLALRAAARGLVLAGVHDLEVVDVTVGLVEVAVAVEVVAVPLVELGQLGLDLGGGVTGVLALGDPGGDAVPDRVPGGRIVLVGAVAGLVVGDLDPVGHLALDRVAARRLLLVVLLQRLGVLAGAEVQLLEVLLVVVGLPGRAVVVGTVRLGYLVVQRARRASVAAVDLVSELDQDREDLVGLLPAELDVLVLALELDDLRAVPVLDLGGAGYDLVERLFALGLLGLGQRTVEVVSPALGRLRVVPVNGCGCGRGGRVRLGHGEGREGGGGRGHRDHGRRRSELPGSAGHLSSSPASGRAEGGGSLAWWVRARVFNACSQVTTLD
ncbi:hypothetical protein SALBM311S_07747 [Streptomyces alboniger]